jgi:hypothetical protein
MSGAVQGWAELVGPCLTPLDVAALLESPVERVLERPDLLRLDSSTGVVFPVFQFNGRSVLPGLAHVIAVLDGPLLPLTIVSWLRAPSSELQGRTPEQALREGDEEPVQRVAAAFAAAAAG